MPNASPFYPPIEPGLSPRAYLVELCHYAAADDDARFMRALGGLWDECAVPDTPVRPWHDLATAPVGCCPSAITGDELALFVALLIAADRDFAPPPRRRRKKQPTPHPLNAPTA
jgi:hypothetical protein